MKRYRPGLVLVAASAIAATMLASAVWAAPGDLDTSFSGNGKVTANIFDGDQAEALAIQGDGKIVAAGWGGASPNYDMELARFNKDGSLDTANFGMGGKVRVYSGTSNTRIERAFDVLAMPSGKIVVAGYETASETSTGTGNFFVVRLDSHGSPDTSFKGDGKVGTSFGPHLDKAYALAVDKGKILAAGLTITDTGVEIAMARYHTDGTLDTSFGGTGKVTTAYPGGGSARATDVAVQSDGKIVVSAYANCDFAVVRYHDNGTIDHTFSGNGWATTDFGSCTDSAEALAIQSNGKIVVAGTEASKCALARYTSTGAPDTGFGNGGKVTTSFTGGNTLCNDVAMDAGKPVVVGTFQNSKTFNSDFAVLRYTSAGKLDNTFSGNGKTTTDFGKYDHGQAVAIKDNGKIVAGGEGGASDFALARYLD